VAIERERILSEFVDAWNAGRRPDVDEHIARAPEHERAELAEELLAFLAFAPAPSYGDAALQAIREEPIVVEALAAAGERGGLLPSLLPRLRERRSLTTAQLAAELVAALRLTRDREAKTAAYLERLEGGELEPARISRRVFDALARVLRVPRGELEGAGDLSGWGASPAPVFRAGEDAAEAISPHLELLADALAAPGGAGRDEVDDLFLGGR
jgi:transcriptional regulator with XRE-family HTH domain